MKVSNHPNNPHRGNAVRVLVLLGRKDVRDKRRSAGQSSYLPAIPTMADVVLVGRSAYVATRVADELPVNVPHHRRAVRLYSAVATCDYGSPRVRGPARLRIETQRRH